MAFCFVFVHMLNTFAENFSPNKLKTSIFDTAKSRILKWKLYKYTVIIYIILNTLTFSSPKTSDFSLNFLYYP